MIERRFTFRGRCYQRDFYRDAWDKLVTRVRLLGDVDVVLNGESYRFSAVHAVTDLPTSEIQLELRWPGDKPQTVVTSPTILKSLSLALGDNCEVVRTFRPAISCPMWARLRFIFIEPPPSYFRRDATR